jgi:hypothetical protein
MWVWLIGVVLAGEGCGGKKKPGADVEGSTEPQLQWRASRERVESAPISLTA